jgi:anti-anti-sigma factor
MEATAFAATLRPIDAGLIIDLSGDINGGADDAFNAVTQRALDQKPHALLLNFSAVGYINSTGIALIVGLLAAARKNGIPLRTYGLSDHYQEIFTITRLSDFMSIVSDEAAALGAD